MPDEEFKLSSDDTMRRLRQIAQAPGELQWRLELVATIERIRMQHLISTRAILQNQRAMQKSISHITQTKLAALVNAEIDQREKAKDSEKYRAGWKQFRNHLFTAATSIVVALIIAYWRFKK
jgi:hypothetical protein